MKLHTTRMGFERDAAMDVADARAEPIASRIGEDGLENGTYNVLRDSGVFQAMAEMGSSNQEASFLTEVEQIFAAVAAWDRASDLGGNPMHDSGDGALLDTSFPEFAVLYEQHDISSDDFSVDETASPAEADLDGIIDAVTSTEPAPGLETIVDDRDADTGNEQEAEEPEPPDDPTEVLQM